MTKSAGSCGFGTFTEEILHGKLHFLCSDILKMCEKPNASDLMRFLINIKMKVKNRSHIYGINKTRPRHGHKYNKHKKVLQYNYAYLY